MSNSRRKQESSTERRMKSAEWPTYDSIAGRTPRTVPRIPESSRICRVNRYRKTHNTRQNAYLSGERTPKITKT